MWLSKCWNLLDEIYGLRRKIYDGIYWNSHQANDGKTLGRRRDGVLHVDQRFPRRHLDRLVRRDAGAEEAEETSEGPAYNEAHDSSEGAALKDPLHHDLLARLDPGHPG